MLNSTANGAGVRGRFSFGFRALQNRRRVGSQDHRFSVAPMHHKCLSVRMKISPSETASEAFIGSPPIEFVARHSNFGLARNTNTSAFWFGAYSRSPASTGADHDA